MSEALRHTGPYPVQRIGFADLRDTLRKGVRDLVAAPAYGLAIGALFATLISSAGVVGYLLLLAWGCDFITAIATSLQAVAVNPAPMLA